MTVSYYTQLRKFYGRMSFYITHFASYLIPNVFFRWQRNRLIASLPLEEQAEADRRAGYYCQAGKREHLRTTGCVWPTIVIPIGRSISL